MTGPAKEKGLPLTRPWSQAGEGASGVCRLLWMTAWEKGKKKDSTKAAPGSHSSGERNQGPMASGAFSVA